MAIATTDPPENKPQRLLLISVPRTASNLLLKILNIHHQPNFLTGQKGGYFFYDGFLTATHESRLNRPTDKWSDLEKTEVRNTFQQCLNSLEEYSAQAQRDNKVMFAKEHAFWFINPAVTHVQPGDSPSTKDDKLNAFRVNPLETYGPEQTFSENNHTVLPDEYLRTWKIAFLIRHPALAWPSMYRAMTKMSKLGILDDDGVKGASLLNMTLTWTRKLFDWCLEQPDEQTVPLVMDANDIIHNPGSVLRFCEATGLDTNAVRFEWSEENDANKLEGWVSNDPSNTHHKAARIMLSTLEASKGVVKDKTPATVDIKAEAEKWKAEFGDEIAGCIEKAVWDAMPDYEYLKERRVRC